MRILLINPNTTASMTNKMAQAARAVASAGTEIVATNSQDGPSSIQGYYDAAVCVPGLLDEVQRHTGFHAIVVGCFDDTGLDAIRCMVSVPVVGIGEAAYHAASLVANKFSVITTLSRSVVGLESNLLRYGFARKCVRVRATDIPVLKLEDEDEATLNIIRQEISNALSKDKAEAIVLGCAGMSDLMQMLSEEFSVPVIDGVVCGVMLAEGLVRCGLHTSKIGGYGSISD